MEIIDPRKFSWKRNSPYAIYSSGRWSGSREDPLWQDRALSWARHNSSIYRGEPSWKESSVVNIVTELFYLHLTIREITPEIAEALTFLIDMKNLKNLKREKTNELPFETENDPDFVTHAWLFSAAVFGRANKTDWLETAEAAGRNIKSDFQSSSCSIYNFLRGTLIIPEAEEIPGVIEAIKLLASRQREDGIIRGLAPWQVYNLMAHSSNPHAVNILEKLEANLLEKQNPDGSWGIGRQKPLATFLMAHGLQKRGFFDSLV